MKKLKVKLLVRLVVKSPRDSNVLQIWSSWVNKVEKNVQFIREVKFYVCDN